MIRTLCLAAALLACTPAPLAAQEDEDGEFCPGGRTQAEMNECAAAELARADTLLNRRYQALLRTLEPHRVEPLRAAQRAWIRFRDAECDFEASEVAGGSLEPMVHALCPGLPHGKARGGVRAHPGRRRWGGMTFEDSILVRETPEALFALTQDYGRRPQRDPFLRSAERGPADG